jgi:hypothetical protein
MYLQLLSLLIYNIYVKKPERLSGLPLQLRIFLVANQNAIKQYWDISQKAQDNKEKIQALEHYLDCHLQLWSLLYGGEDHMVRFGKLMPPQEYQYKEDHVTNNII